jgi:exopolysaccharide biosynthesis polyprenyl glycosylphosphotransferase
VTQSATRETAAAAIPTNGAAGARANPAHSASRPRGRPVAIARSAARPPTEHILTEVYRFADTAMVLAVLISVFVVSNLGQMPQGLSEFLAVRLTIKNLLLIIGFTGAWRLLAGWCGLYDVSRIRTRRSESIRVVLTCAVGSVVALVFPLASVSAAFRFDTILYFWAGTTALTLLIRSVGRGVAATRSTAPRSVLIVGSGPRAVELCRLLRLDPKRYHVLGFVDRDYEAAAETVRSQTLGSTEELDAILMRYPVDEVLIALPQRSRYAEIQRTIELCEEAGVQVKYLADAFRVSLARPSYDPSERLPFITMQMVSDDYRLGIKRWLDVVGALAGMVLFSPLILVTAAAIKLTSRGPILFAQERYGRNKHRIKMYKFRTMVAEAESLLPALESHNEAVGPIFKIRNDPRFTPLGRVLRKMSIDEIPQLWNVLRGEMSLVGPRPMSLRDVSMFSEPALMRRFSVTPGITGLWQVSGRSNLTFDQWIALDLAYIDRWSLWLDFLILLRTPWVVLRADGAA